MATGRRRADHLLLQALACGATVEVAASKAGISSRTAFRRLQDPAFQRALQELRSEMVQRSASMLTAAGPELVKKLLQLATADPSSAIQLGAARAGLQLGVKFREVVDLEQRFKALEQALDPARGTGETAQRDGPGPGERPPADQGR